MQPDVADLLIRDARLLVTMDEARRELPGGVTASGSVIRKTDPHQNRSRHQPESIGPSAAIAAPIPDHSAIDFVRAGPDHSAVISARVVG